MLDESTASLDTKCEGILQQALLLTAEERTALRIAHKPSTVPNSSSISKFYAGVVMERAGHKDLISRPGGTKNKFEGVLAPN